MFTYYDLLVLLPPSLLMKICIMYTSRSCHVISCRLTVVYFSSVYETPIIGCYNAYMFMFSLISVILFGPLLWMRICTGSFFNLFISVLWLEF